MMDWDTFYFEYWILRHEAGDEPTAEEYRDWLYDKADLTLGEARLVEDAIRNPLTSPTTTTDPRATARETTEPEGGER